MKLKYGVQYNNQSIDILDDFEQGVVQSINQNRLRVPSIIVNRLVRTNRFHSDSCHSYFCHCSNPIGHGPGASRAYVNGLWPEFIPRTPRCLREFYETGLGRWLFRLESLLEELAWHAHCLASEVIP